MTIDQEEKTRLAQLGCDRRLAEAVAALDEEAATLTRIAGDENSTEDEVMQAASNYRAAVQRRNVAYDRACGVPEGEAGKAVTATVTVEPPDEEALRKLVDEAIAAKEPAEAEVNEGALRTAVGVALKAQLPALVKAELAKANWGDGSEPRKASGGSKAGASS